MLKKMPLYARFLPDALFRTGGPQFASKRHACRCIAAECKNVHGACIRARGQDLTPDAEALRDHPTKGG
jgi:hypothetical protein